MSIRNARVNDSKLPVATKTSKLRLALATEAKEEAKMKVGNKQSSKTRETLPNIRKKSTSLQDAGMVKRRLLSVVENNDQVRRGSVDGEKTKNARKESYKSDKNENQQHISANEKGERVKSTGLLSSSDSLIKHRKSMEKSRIASGKAKKTDDNQDIPKENIPPSARRKLLETLVAMTRQDELTVVEVVSPAVLPLSDGIINIDLDDGMYEYGAEIVAYLKEREKLFVLPEDFLLQNSVTESMRSILVDWLIQVHHYFKFSPETLYLTIAMLDYVLNKRDVDPDKLQLVGATALWIASKAEEYYSAEIAKLIHLTKDSYKKHHVIQMEQIMLRILDFNIYFPDPKVFLLRFARAALRSHDSTFIATCQLLMDSFIVSYSYSSTPPSLRAAGSVLASLHLFSAAVVVEEPSLECWTKALAHYTGYSLGEVAPIAVAMLEEVARAAEDVDYKFKAVYTKYKSNSQHKKLVFQPHLATQVILKAAYNVRASHNMNN